MHTASSASETCGECASAVEYIATVRTPCERAERMTREAISPRFAISILSNGGVVVCAFGCAGCAVGDDEKRRCKIVVGEGDSLATAVVAASALENVNDDDVVVPAGRRRTKVDNFTGVIVYSRDIYANLLEQIKIQRSLLPSKSGEITVCRFLL